MQNVLTVIWPISLLTKCCEEYKFEEAALIKANDEHLTVGFAKKILGKSKSYARAVTPLVSASSGGLLPPVSVSITPTVIKNKFEGLGSDKPESRSGNNFKSP